MQVFLMKVWKSPLKMRRERIPGEQNARIAPCNEIFQVNDQNLKQRLLAKGQPLHGVARSE